MTFAPSPRLSSLLLCGLNYPHQIFLVLPAFYGRRHPESRDILLGRVLLPQEGQLPSLSEIQAARGHDAATAGATFDGLSAAAMHVHGVPVRACPPVSAHVPRRRVARRHGIGALARFCGAA